MELPNDPNILASFLNMKLRDEDYDSLDSLFNALGYDKNEVLKQLENAGFQYLESIRQFR